MKNIFTISFFSLFTVSCLLPPASCFSQPVTFEKWYDYGFGENGKCVQQTTDGGYIIAGVQGVAMGISKNLLIKTDSMGNVKWFKLFGGANDNELSAIKQTTDGGYIMTGMKTGTQNNYYDITWLKTDANGDTVWTRRYTPPPPVPYGYGKDVMQTPDGGYVILANYNDTTVGGASMLIKTDSNGDTLWTKKYKRIYPGILMNGMLQTQNGEFIMAGYTATPFPYNYDYFVIKTDSNGDTLWTKILNAPYQELAQTIQQTTNGLFLLTGGIADSNNVSDIYIVKTNTNIDTLWTKKIGGQTNDNAISSQVNYAAYIILGGTTSYGAGSTDVYLVKTDTFGNVQWQKTFGTTGPDEGNFVRQTSDGGFVITGQRFTNADAYLIKTDSAGNVLTSVSENNFHKPSLLVYPNPFTEQTTVLLPKRIRKNKETEFNILDILGREVFRQKIRQGDNIIIFDRNNLPAGVYLLQVFLGTEILGSAKIVIQ